RELPDKTYFLDKKFGVPPLSTNLFEQPFAWTNTFPLVITNQLHLALGMFYLAFNSQGQLVRFDSSGRTVPGRDEFIPLVKGSIFHPQAADGTYAGRDDVVETPRNNRRYLRVNWLTGRAQVLGDQVILDSGKASIQEKPE